MRRLALSLATAGLLAFPAALGPVTASARTDSPPISPSTPIGGELLGGKGVVFDPAGGADAPPEVTSQAYVVADAATGDILAAKNAHALHRPASTLKTLTALTALGLGLDFDTTYTATYEDDVAEGASAGLVEGSTYTLRDLMYGMFVKSGNDAATAVANVGGGVQPFVARMNEQARALQAYDTTAVGPSGLDEDGQFTSAYDLALIGRAALAHPELIEFATTKVYPFPDKNPPPGRVRGTYDIYSIQRFVLNYDDALGIKNGYTTLARQTLIAASQRDGRTVLVTLLQSEYSTWPQAAELSDWAYANADRVTPVGELVDPVVVPEASEAQVRAAPTGLSPRDGQRSTMTALLLAGVIGGGSAGGVLLLSRAGTSRRPTRRESTPRDARRRTARH